LEFVCTCSRYDEDILSRAVVAPCGAEDLPHHTLHTIAGYRLADAPADGDPETRAPDRRRVSNHDERPKTPALAMPL
jgi:hypothetical protein